MPVAAGVIVRALPEMAETVVFEAVFAEATVAPPAIVPGLSTVADALPVVVVMFALWVVHDWNANAPSVQ